MTPIIQPRKLVRLGSSSRANNGGPRKSGARSFYLVVWRINRLAHGSASGNPIPSPPDGLKKHQTIQDLPTGLGIDCLSPQNGFVCTGRDVDDQLHRTRGIACDAAAWHSLHLATARPSLYYSPCTATFSRRTITGLDSFSQVQKRLDEAKANGEPREPGRRSLWHVGSQINHPFPS